MKTTNVGLDNAYAIVRGWVSAFAAAASGLISISDETTGTSVAPVNSITLPGQLLNDGGLGNIVIDVQAVLTEYLNNSGVDLVYGDVVVIDTSADLAVTTTTTAQDTRPVGIVLAAIGAGGTGPVQTGGVVQLVNVTASVTRGTFAETSTSAKEATSNATQRTGSFGIFVESGTTPTMLFLGGTSTSAPGVYETVIEGGGSVIKAHGNLGSTETFDPVDGNVHTGTLNANCTFTLTPPTSATTACTLELNLTQDGTGGWTITWPGSVTTVGTYVTTLSTTTKVFLETLDGGTTWTAYVGSASVTSVALTVPAEFSVSGSPVTTSGTLAITKANESANLVWAGPTSGSAAQPTFRALTAADMPAGVGGTDHEHVMDCLFSGDASTTVWELPAAPFDAYSVAAYVAGSLTEVTLSGTMLTTATFGSAPGSGTNNIRFDIVAAVT